MYDKRYFRQSSCPLWIVSWISPNLAALFDISLAAEVLSRSHCTQWTFPYWHVRDSSTNTVNDHNQIVTTKFKTFQWLEGSAVLFETCEFWPFLIWQSNFQSWLYSGKSFHVKIWELNWEFFLFANTHYVRNYLDHCQNSSKLSHLNCYSQGCKMILVCNVP